MFIVQESGRHGGAVVRTVTSQQSSLQVLRLPPFGIILKDASSMEDVARWTSDPVEYNTPTDVICKENLLFFVTAGNQLFGFWVEMKTFQN